LPLIGYFVALVTTPSLKVTKSYKNMNHIAAACEKKKQFNLWKVMGCLGVVATYEKEEHEEHEHSARVQTSPSSIPLLQLSSHVAFDANGLLS
jgi:hypothetical protein